MLRRTGTSLLTLTVFALPVLVGCSGGGGSEESAPELLARAKTTLDEASSAHFVLDSEGAPDSGTLLVGGEGDIARPSSRYSTRAPRRWRCSRSASRRRPVIGT